jgi:hypothetical protein
MCEENEDVSRRGTENAERANTYCVKNNLHLFSVDPVGSSDQRERA